jgi:hypothetical protein
MERCRCRYEQGNDQGLLWKDNRNAELSPSDGGHSIVECARENRAVCMTVKVYEGSFVQK